MAPLNRRAFLVGSGLALVGGMTVAQRLLMSAHGSGGFGVGYPTCYGYTLTKQGLQLARGSAGTWNAAVLESPAVFWDAPHSQWVLVAVGYTGTPAAPVVASLGVWTRADLDTGSWTAYGSNPFISRTSVGGDPDQNGLSGPLVWYEAGTYYLFYIGLTATGYEQGTKRLCLATSTDWIPGTNSGTWTRHGAVISPAGGTSWRATAIWHPSIVKRNATYYLFFNATGNVGATERIGYATSSDLLTWTVDDVNSPIVSPGSGWESAYIGDPSVYRSGNYWFMAYYGGNGTVSQDGYATTTDALFPLGWTKYSGNPVMPLGAPGEYDETGAAKPFIVVTATKLYHWYTANDGPPDYDRNIGLATQAIGTATGGCV